MASTVSITFTDKESGDEAFICVRVVGDGVGLAVSLRSDGDVEVFLAQEQVDRLIQGLSDARARVGSSL